jgi:hypothetical protein
MRICRINRPFYNYDIRPTIAKLLTAWRLTFSGYHPQRRKSSNWCYQERWCVQQCGPGAQLDSRQSEAGEKALDIIPFFVLAIRKICVWIPFAPIGLHCPRPIIGYHSSVVCKLVPPRLGVSSFTYQWRASEQCANWRREHSIRAFCLRAAYDL